MNKWVICGRKRQYAEFGGDSALSCTETEKESGELFPALFFGCDGIIDVLEDLPFGGIGLEAQERRDEAGAEGFRPVGQELTDKLAELLGTGLYLEHIALSITQPGFPHIELAADQRDHRIGWGGNINFIFSDNSALDAETVGEFLLREVKRIAQLFDATANGHRQHLLSRTL